VKPASGGGRRPWQRSALLVAILAVIAVRLAWGHSYCAEGLPFYSIDENDIVEPAAGFLMGDWNHQYYTYGPVFMYLLSLLYAVAGLLTGHGVHLFATDVFFDPYWHYYLARLLSLVVILAIAAVAIVETERCFSFLAALVCLVVLAFPIVENFTSYTARIDVLQAFFQLLALFSIIRIFASGAMRDYVLAGAWIGLAIACKPIAGGLIVPIALGVAFLRSWRERAPGLRGRPLVGKAAAVIVSFVSDRRLLLAIGVGIAAFAIGFPLAILDFKNFWLQQMSRIRADSAEAFPRGGDLVHYVPQAGWFLSALGVVALLYQLWRGSAAARILAAFATFYLFAFFRVPAREYFFVPIVAPVSICMSLMLTDLLDRLGHWSAGIVLMAVLGLLIWFTLPPPRGHWWQHEQLAMQRWVTENVPRGTKLCYAGWYTNGPRLVSSQAETEAQNDYFMYGRDKNQHYVAGFMEAHRRYVLSGRPIYEIANWGRRDLSTPVKQAELLDFCATHGSRYLILGGVPPFPSLPAPLKSGAGISIIGLERSGT